jgi:serine/threonine-protein kinase HipA
VWLKAGGANPDQPDRLSTAIDLDDPTADIATALSVSGYFRLTLAEARTAIASIRDATASWRIEAAALNLPRREIERMADAFETDQRRAAQHIEP